MKQINFPIFMTANWQSIYFDKKSTNMTNLQHDHIQ